MPSTAESAVANLTALGLGLAIVRAIAEAHGGRVDLADAPGGGSVFRLVLPLLLS
jgi:signal transduction histidine kinase